MPLPVPGAGRGEAAARASGPDLPTGCQPGRAERLADGAGAQAGAREPLAGPEGDMAPPRRLAGRLHGAASLRARLPRDALPLSLAPSNKPNPNQISVNNLKAGVVNGAGVPGQSPGAGRACESCYSKCPGPGPPPPAAPRTEDAGRGAGPGGRLGAGARCVLLSAATGSA